jgi:hypothetical protein
MGLLVAELSGGAEYCSRLICLTFLRLASFGQKFEIQDSIPMA